MITLAFDGVVGLFAAAEPVAANPVFPWSTLLLALVLVLLAVALALTEIFIVSMGILALAAIGCAFAAIILAFSISSGVGWAFLLLVPVLGMMVGSRALRRLQTSRLASQTAIVADAGYHQLIDRIGLVPGALGELVTDAVPTGRARFTGSLGTGEFDVTVNSSAGRKGDRVRLLRIDGPRVVVAVE